MSSVIQHSVWHTNQHNNLPTISVVSIVTTHNHKTKKYIIVKISAWTRNGTCILPDALPTELPIVFSTIELESNQWQSGFFNKLLMPFLVHAKIKSFHHTTSCWWNPSFRFLSKKNLSKFWFVFFLKTIFPEFPRARRIRTANLSASSLAFSDRESFCFHFMSAFYHWITKN